MSLMDSTHPFKHINIVALEQ